MRFVKMHGLGNDYIYVDTFKEKVDDPEALSRAISDRHFGIGGDGLVLICPPTESANDARMRMFNADGSEAEMCGNAIRCVAKYLYETGRAKRERQLIETGRGTLALDLEVNGNVMKSARVNMRAPILEAKDIPTTLAGSPVKDVPLEVAGRVFHVTCVSVGNPHAVIFVDEITDELVLGYGPKIEVHPAFPRRINVEFVKVVSPTEVRMRVWERGSGETLACGTGACAVAVAGAITGRTQRKVRVHLIGGSLDLEWSTRDDCVYMTGPASIVFEGEFDPTRVEAKPVSSL